MHELRQSVEDVLASLKVQVGVLIVMIGNILAALFELLPDIITTLSGIGGLIILYTIIRRNRAEERKFNAQAEILEARERARKSDIEKRHEKGLPCRRCTDEVLGDES